TLGDMAHIAGGLPVFALPDIPWNLDTLRIIAPYAILMALVGLLETLLTLNLTDEITETRGYPDRECVALGAANMVSGAFGGMG
ncbi:sulfate permease family protein, partial [Pseudomonas syringae pv. actinidiae ICMP 19079]